MKRIIVTIALFFCGYDYAETSTVNSVGTGMTRVEACSLAKQKVENNSILPITITSYGSCSCEKQGSIWTCEVDATIEE